MTERTGGSDVSGTGTRAEPAHDGDDATFRLSGTKWFTSATTSQMAMTLARLPGAPDGGAGLSLFQLPLVRDADGLLAGITVHRLKEKLGTHALPTAELTLTEAPARLVGGAGPGVRKIASLFNVTRVWNAGCAAAGMRRAVMLARDYAARRVAFGRPLLAHPLHVEALEAFGGAGYVEDTGLPRLLRDAQVLAIWEGTTNVLALDVLRAIEREDALTPHLADVEGWARELAYAIARVTIGTLLVEHAAWAAYDAEGAADAPASRAAAVRWCARPLAPCGPPDEASRSDARALLGA